MVTIQTANETLAEKLTKPEATARAVLSGSDRKYDLKWAAVRGSRLAYVEVGSGEPVIFVHGGFVDFTIWDQQLPAVG